MIDIFDKSNPVDVEFRVPQLEEAITYQFDKVCESSSIEELVMSAVTELTGCRAIVYSIKEFGEDRGTYLIQYKRGRLVGKTAFVVFLRCYDSVSGKEVVWKEYH